MKATPYELVFGQPPQHNIFPGAKGERIMEEDVEDLFDKEDDCESGVSGGDKPVGDPGTSDGAQKDGCRLGAGEELAGDPDSDGHTVVLASTEKHRKLQEEADKRYRDNAEKMQLKYCKGKRKRL